MLTKRDIIEALKNASEADHNNTKLKMLLVQAAEKLEECDCEGI